MNKNVIFKYLLEGIDPNFPQICKNCIVCCGDILVYLRNENIYFNFKSNFIFKIL